MHRADAARDNRLQAVTRSAAQNRIIAAALDLFGRHGVSGTSLQMIADQIGVTKAAVYHQFKTKDEIVIAVAEVDLLKLQTALDAAETEVGTRAREVLVTLVIDLAVERRRLVTTIQRDPVIVGYLARHAPFQEIMNRLFTSLTGGDPGPAARVRAAMFAAAIGGVMTHPLVADLDDETLKSEILRVTRVLLDLPDLPA